MLVELKLYPKLNPDCAVGSQTSPVCIHSTYTDMWGLKQA